MRSKKATYTLIVVLVILGLFLVSRWQEPEIKEIFDRSPGELVYTRHALCRMDCRKISNKEPFTILKNILSVLPIVMLQMKKIIWFLLI